MRLIIVGAGGFGREVLSLIKAINAVKPSFEVVGFVDDAFPKGTPIHDLKVLGSVQEIASFGVKNAVIAIGNPKIRKEIVLKIADDFSFPNIIHPSVIFQDAERIKMGTGAIICAGNIFTTDIKIGNYCIVNLSCTIGHDAELGDFNSIMPGVNISGGAKLASYVYVGTGAKLIKSTSVGMNAIIGAGAVVDLDIMENDTVVGVPARPLKSRNEI